MFKKVKKRMKKLTVCVLICVLFCTSAFGSADIHAADESETGTAEAAEAWADHTEAFAVTDSEGNPLGESEETPILIENEEQLAYLAKQVNTGTAENNISRQKYFKLVNNLNLAGKTWTAIGVCGQEFQGCFDGNGKVIENLTVDERVDADTNTGRQAGLFGDVRAVAKNSGRIENLIILGADIKSTYIENPEGGSGNKNIDSIGYAGILAGSVDGAVDNSFRAVVKNCQVQGSVSVGTKDESGEGAAGGFAAYMGWTDIENCSAYADVDGYGRVGGFSAAMESVTVKGCRTSGTALGNWAVGGFAGEVWGDSDISSSYANVDITAYDWHAGGFAGYAMERSEFKECVATGNIASHLLAGYVTQSGGFVGGSMAAISRCYATGNVSATDPENPVAGFIGNNFEDIVGDETVTGKVTECTYNQSAVTDGETKGYLSNDTAETIDLTAKSSEELDTILHEKYGHMYHVSRLGIRLTEDCRSGYTGDDICGVDEEVVSHGNEFTIKDHVAGTERTNVKEATCGQEGYTGDICCGVCGKVLENGNVTEKLTEHTWDDGKVIKQPTTDQTGIKTYTCSVCGTTKEEILEKLPSQTVIPSEDKTEEIPSQKTEDIVTPSQKTEEQQTGNTEEPTKNTVKPAKVSIKSVKNKKGRKLSITWKKVSKAKKYEIAYSTKKSFKKSATKTKTTAKTSPYDKESEKENVLCTCTCLYTKEWCEGIW